MSADAVADSKPMEGAENVEDIPNGDAMLVHDGGGNNRAYVTVFILFVINLLNYMDRQTIAGRSAEQNSGGI